MKLIKNITDAMEDENHPSLGPTKWILEKFGLLQNSKSQKERYIANFCHCTATLFVFSQYVELWIIRSDFEAALKNLSISILSFICLGKLCNFVIWQSTWNEIMSGISQKELAQLAKGDKKTTAMVKDYIEYCRKITYFYWGLIFATVVGLMFSPVAAYLSSAEYRERIHEGLEPNPEMFSSWVPFDKTKSYGYWAYISWHTLISFYGGALVMSYDSNCVVLMCFFAGQLKLLKEDCKRLFDGDVSDEVVLLRVRELHEQHLFLVKYFNLFNTMLSPVIFLYMVICSLMICISAVQTTQEGTTKTQQLWLAEYSLALIVQLYVYCWHGNEVVFFSSQVADGVYESGWWHSNARMRRIVLLLSGLMRRQFVFSAGPFTPLTVQTFLAILKGSYSYYAIFRKKY